MKCLVCDSEWPDDWVTCPRDGNDLRSPTPTVERPVPDESDPDMIAPAYGAPPMPDDDEVPPPRKASRDIAAMKAAMKSRRAPAPQPEPPKPSSDAAPTHVLAGPTMMPAYGMPPISTGTPRPLLALLIVAVVIGLAALSVALSR